MDELYKIVHQATYRFFGIDELYKLVMDEMYEIGWFIAKFEREYSQENWILSFLFQWQEELSYNANNHNLNNHGHNVDNYFLIFLAETFMHTICKLQREQPVCRFIAKTLISLWTNETTHTTIFSTDNKNVLTLKTTYTTSFS